MSLFEALDEETTLGSRKKREDYLSFCPFPSVFLSVCLLFPSLSFWFRSSPLNQLRQSQS